MLVRQAHEIDWVKKNYNSISPTEYYERIKPTFEKENIVFNGFIGEWNGNATKMNLSCREGHDFYPTIHNFQTGTRCSTCGIKGRGIPKEEYIERLKPIFIKENIIFNGFIGEWKGNKTKLNLICSEGHDFYPIINSFQAGKRCSRCANNYALSKEEYIERLKPIFIKENIIFNGFIGEWKGVKTSLNLICERAHNFTTTITNFQHGSRCPECKAIKLRELKLLPEEEYIERLKPTFEKENIVFNGFIGEWNGSKTKLNLICCEGHGFTPTIAKFQTGRRCPKCSKSGYSSVKHGTLYIQKLINGRSFVGVKFGVTNLTTEKRMKQQRSKSKFDHEIFYELTLQDGQKILELENRIKEAMKGKTSYISKEDMPDGYTETVAPSELSTIMYIVKSFEKELTA